MIHIDAHGSDHGLSIVIDIRPRLVYSRECRSTVTVRQWSECCEPDEHGSYSPHISSVTICLDQLFEGRHAQGIVSDGRSQHRKIADYALAYLGYYGGEEEESVSDDDRPCQHFGNYWGRLRSNLQNEDILLKHPERFKCPTCGAMPDGDYIDSGTIEVTNDSG